MSPLLVGEIVVATVATLLAALELWLATVRRSREHAWAGLICLGTGAYAGLQFFFYQVGTASQAITVQQLEDLALGVLTLAVFEYGATRRGLARKWPRRVARALMLLSIVPILTTRWFVAANVDWLHFGSLDHLVPEPDATFPLGVLFLAFCLALAASGARDILKAEQRSWLLVAGLGAWVLAGLSDLLAILHLTDGFPLVEYGFLGFAVALAAQHANEYAALLERSERARDELSQEKRQIDELSHTVVLRVEEGIVLVDAHGLIRIWNPMMEQISGRAADDSVGRHYTELLPEALHGALLGQTIARVLGTRAAETLELAMPNGAAASLAIVPASNDPANHSFIVVLRDITRQRELTERMMEMDRMIAAGTLAAGVGHEINNPLSYVLTNIELAREQVTASADPRLHELDEILREAAEGARRIRDVVEQLRAMVRPDDRASTRAVPLARVLDWATKMAASEIRSRATLERSYDPTATALGNESELGQVFLNLVLNAAQAIQPGAAAKNRIRLTTKRVGDLVRAEVADTGAGIPASEIERIFEPFFTTKARDQGTGLGLAISRRIVQQHGGRIEVQSEPGKGTRFVVELPAMDAIPSVRAPAASGHASSRLRLLIVDDDRLVARSLARSLGREHDVVQCFSGAEALAELVGDAHFDVVLSDIMMGDMDGIQLYESVERDYPELAGRVVLMTGGLLTAKAQTFQCEHPDQVLHKPLERAELAALVARFQPVATRSSGGLCPPQLASQLLPPPPAAGSLRSRRA